jgi:hypothetical protein
MIYIIKNQANNVVLTLNELVTNATYDVLFVFTNDSTGQQKIFTANDTSTSTGRYNKFQITDTVTEDLYNGKINLTVDGYWSYVVYEMPVMSPPSLNPALAVKALEIGKVLVTETITPDVIFNNNDTKNNIVFE